MKSIPALQVFVFKFLVDRLLGKKIHCPTVPDSPRHYLLVKWFLKNSLAIASCALITAAGIAFVVWTTAPAPTIIGEDIVTRDLAVTRNLIAETGRTATIVVAASNSLPRSKAQADFVADGVDDNLTIQAAIDALPPGGGKVLLMEGTFHMAHSGRSPHASVILDRPNTTLSGVGTGTVLRLKNAAGTTGGRMILLLEAASPSIVRDLKVDGNRANNPDLIYPPGYVAATMWNNTGSIFERMKILNMPGHGLGITAGEGNKIINNQILNHAADGIAVDGTTTTEATGNIISTNLIMDKPGGLSRDGIDIGSYAPGNVVIGNTSIGDNIGIHVGSPGNTIQGNTIINAVNLGILLNPSASLSTVTGNIFRGSGGIAIDVHSNQNLFSGNVLYENSRTSSAVVFLIRGCFNLIQGNQIRGGGVHIPPYGVKFIPGATNNTIRDNDIVIGTWGIAIRDQGTNNTWTETYSELFMDVLAASTTHVIAPTQSLVTVPAANIISPDVPRNISVTQAGTGTPTAGNVTVTGIDARGRTISETIAMPATNTTVFGSKAFATVTEVVGFDAGVNQTLSVGISNKVGLPVSSRNFDRVFRVARNGIVEAVGAVDLVNGTVDLGIITTGDDFLIHYRVNLNVIR